MSDPITRTNVLQGHLKKTIKKIRGKKDEKIVR
jgi:hypothetical protein